MLSQATATMAVKQRKLDVRYAAGSTNRPAASVVLSTQPMMSKTMQVLQLNMQKQRDVQHSEMRGTGLKE
jgi:hypothetical protein